MVELYHSAHCFVFPSFGEGFGLTLAEAMATGLPCVFTPWSALTDLADASCAYPVQFKMIEARLAETGGFEPLAAASGNPGLVPCRMAQADTESVARAMVEVYKHYGRALDKGRRAAKRIRERFTWEQAGRRLAGILREAFQVS